MPEGSGLAEHAARNGAGESAGNGLGGPRQRLPRLTDVGRLGSELTTLGRRAAGGLVGWAKRAAQRRLTADLDDRDPDYIRENLPFLWLLASLWFRGEVRGLGNVPEQGPVLLVGNHSGGNMTPDTILFTVAFSSYFGVE